MYRDTAGSDNAPAPYPPVPIHQRWRCPLCGMLLAHPWHLAIHVAAVAPARPDHGMTELEAWTLTAGVEPLDVTPSRRRSATPAS